MKKLVLTFLVSLCAIFQINAQCDHSLLLEDCKKHLDEDHFIAVKDFSVDSDHGESHEHSFTLSKIGDYEYYFTGEDWSHHHMTATLYDSEHREVASNHTSKDEYTHVIRFSPKETGIYYIKFSFDEGEKFCGSAVIGYHRHED